MPDPYQKMAQMPDPCQEMAQMLDPRQEMAQMLDPRQEMAQMPDLRQEMAQMPDLRQEMAQRPDPRQEMAQMPDSCKIKGINAISLQAKILYLSYLPCKQDKCQILARKWDVCWNNKNKINKNDEGLKFGNPPCINHKEQRENLLFIHILNI